MSGKQVSVEPRTSALNVKLLAATARAPAAAARARAQQQTRRTSLPLLSIDGTALGHAATALVRFCF